MTDIYISPTIKDGVGTLLQPIMAEGSVRYQYDIPEFVTPEYAAARIAASERFEGRNPPVSDSGEIIVRGRQLLPLIEDAANERDFATAERLSDEYSENAYKLRCWFNGRGAMNIRGGIRGRGAA